MEKILSLRSFGAAIVVIIVEIHNVSAIMYLGLGVLSRYNGSYHRAILHSGYQEK